ncbi:hypothetical protein HanPSC8_Chr06g0253351 [Helianthus annuus]|nr:hypothetical protein HanPSC8_Chr06g0253351 [Helianthus annuus]
MKTWWSSDSGTAAGAMAMDVVVYLVQFCPARFGQQKIGLRVHIRLVRVRHRDGSIQWVSIQSQVGRDSGWVNNSGGGVIQLRLGLFEFRFGLGLNSLGSSFGSGQLTTKRVRSTR